MDIPKKIKREKALTVRITQTAYDKLCNLAAKNKASQADVVEYLIEKAYEEEPKNKKK